MDVLTQMKTATIEQKPEHFVQKSAAERAGWVLADCKFVAHILEAAVNRDGYAPRNHAIVYGFAHEATGRMWVTTIYYREDYIHLSTKTRVYSEEPCADSELETLELQAWANLYSAMSCK